MVAFLRRLFLTFDTEDFISENSLPVLQWILERLKKHDMEALFFITGHMAEKLKGFPIIIDLLGEHQIGYHSSSHTVHPTIFEFTDVEDYGQAYRISLKRETSHINPLTGEIEGKGGILALRELFHSKQIVSFRAPGHCWTPPHLEALKTLGIAFDFSTDLSPLPIDFKGITFYPYPIMGHWQGKSWEHRLLLASLLRKKLSILTVHPSLLANKDEWDSIYFDSNPKSLSPPHSRSPDEIKKLLHSFDLLISRITRLQKTHMVETTPKFEKSNRDLKVNRSDVEECYQWSMRWALDQNYRPKFLLSHFFKFFQIDTQAS
jgi:peptidoglycan/xylan/chitin deacetylase (PgdA/CDA1 family)